MVTTLEHKILNGYQINKEEALELVYADLEELCQAANRIREYFCKDGFDICTIINGKCGRCSENCKFCAQSSFYHTDVETYSLLDAEECLQQVKYNEQKGVLRFSIVTSGKALNDEEVEKLCETSRRNFPNICTTHTYDEKIASIQAAKRAGLNVCSGGLMGLGETMEERIDMALDLRKLDIHSVPVNMLSPIKGTPYENNVPLTIEEMRRIVAIYRFILPDASIRLAGGRGLLDDKGRTCFQSGSNAVISGDLLTTSGMTIDSDMAMIQELGFTPRLWNK